MIGQLHRYQFESMKHTGLPILPTLGHLYSYIASCFVDPVTHAIGSPVLEQKYESVPCIREVMTPDASKSAASPVHPHVQRAHVLLFSMELDIGLVVKDTVSSCLPVDRVTIICPKEASERALEGSSSLQHHADFLLSARKLNTLGHSSSAIQAPTHFVSACGSPFVLLSVLCIEPAVGVKPQPDILLFDSFMSPVDMCMQLGVDLTVNTPDLSSTCIEFVGIFQGGRECRVLLDKWCLRELCE